MLSRTPRGCVSTDVDEFTEHCHSSTSRTQTSALMGLQAGSVPSRCPTDRSEQPENTPPQKISMVRAVIKRASGSWRRAAWKPRQRTFTMMTQTRHIGAHGEHAVAPTLHAASSLVSPTAAFAAVCKEAASYDHTVGFSKANMTELAGELILEIGSYLATPEALAVSPTCKRLLTCRNQLLVGLLGRCHGIVLDQAEPFLQASQAVLALTHFVQGSSVPCERASFTKMEPTHLLASYRFYDEGAAIHHVHVSWEGIMLYGGRSPPRHLKPLPWRSILGWITILKTKGHGKAVNGQVKIVARGVKDTAISYVNVWLRDPQLLHARMICHCEAQARSSKGDWVFTRAGALTA